MAMMAAAVPWLMAAGAAVSAVGAIQSANAQAAALGSQAAAANYNADISDEQAEQSLRVNTMEQLRLQREQRQFMGRQRAAAAQAGVGKGGSTKDILDQSETLAELDRLNLAYEGSLRARGYSTQADLDRFNASAYRGQIGPTRRAGYMSAVGTGLSSAYAFRTGRTL